MASKLPFPPSACIFCRSSFQRVQLTSRTQVAYKWAVKNVNRKNSATDFVTVQLLQDVPKWGAKGSYMELTRGMMRNQLHPFQKARYIVGDELKQFKESGGTTIERDSQFLVNAASRGQKETPQDALAAFTEHLRTQMADRFAEQQAAQAALEPKELPVKTVARISELIEPTITFRRAVNDKAPGVGKNGPWATGTPIFGSVTAADVAQEIKKALSSDTELAAVSIDESNVLFHAVGESSEQRKVKELGAFEYDISIPGMQPLRRKVEVLSVAQSEPAIHHVAEPAPEPGLESTAADALERLRQRRVSREKAAAEEAAKTITEEQSSTFSLRKTPVKSVKET